MVSRCYAIFSCHCCHCWRLWEWNIHTYTAAWGMPAVCIRTIHTHVYRMVCRFVLFETHSFVRTVRYEVCVLTCICHSCIMIVFEWKKKLVIAQWAAAMSQEEIFIKFRFNNRAAARVGYNNATVVMQPTTDRVSEFFFSLQLFNHLQFYYQALNQILQNGNVYNRFNAAELLLLFFLFTFHWNAQNR